MKREQESAQLGYTVKRVEMYGQIVEIKVYPEQESDDCRKPLAVAGRRAARGRCS